MTPALVQAIEIVRDEIENFEGVERHSQADERLKVFKLILKGYCPECGYADHGRTCRCWDYS